MNELLLFTGTVEYVGFFFFFFFRWKESLGIHSFYSFFFSFSCFSFMISCSLPLLLLPPFLLLFRGDGVIFSIVDNNISLKDILQNGGGNSSQNSSSAFSVMSTLGKGHMDIIRTVRCTDNGLLVITGGDDAKICCWKRQWQKRVVRGMQLSIFSAINFCT